MARPDHRWTNLEFLVVVLVGSLAFLLAATPARNSDLWLHLASGRLLAQGQAIPGKDLFSSTTTGIFWVNPTWLSDWILYELYQIDAGQVLVIGKCLLVAVLAGLMFLFRRRGTTPMGIRVAAATAAVVALGPWLPLQPVLLSLLGVVLTLYLLERPFLVEEACIDRARRQRWLLPILFALWANLDSWFFLGPALVVLYALGELVRGRRSPRGDDRGPLFLLTLAGLAACFATPSHYHTLAWLPPLGWSHTEQTLMQNGLGQRLFVAPFGGRWVTAPALASPGGWAYCMLLVGGGLSFARLGRSVHPGRLLAWLALAGLSLYQARTIPFFAMAAGPMLALNLQEWALLRRPGAPKKTRLLVSWSPCLLVLLLLVLAWPGWLQPRPYQPRRWSVQPDVSLIRLCSRLARWHAEQQVRADRSALNFSPEVAHYLAWYCPAEKGFLDSRWPLFDRVADDFVHMRRCLLQSESPGPDPALGPLLEDYRIDRIILADPEWERTTWDQNTQAFRCLLRGKGEWTLVAMEGAATLFERRTGGEPPLPREAFDYRQAAYDPRPDQRAPLTPLRPPQPPQWFEAFYRSSDDRSPDRAEAALHLTTFDLEAERLRPELARQWLVALDTSLVASGLGSAGAGSASALAVRLSQVVQLDAGQFARFLATRDCGPPEALLLAVRAARRALSVNPDDAGAFLLLGEAYMRLARQTREQSWPKVLPIRKVQVLTALEQAAALRPDLDAANAILVQVYQETGQLDRALDHLEMRVPIARQEAAQHGPQARAAARRLSDLEDEVQALKKQVEQAELTYKANIGENTDPSQVVVRANLASRQGLKRQALEMLLQSKFMIFGAPGAAGTGPDAASRSGLRGPCLAGGTGRGSPGWPWARSLAEGRGERCLWRLSGCRRGAGQHERRNAPGTPPTEPGGAGTNRDSFSGGDGNAIPFPFGHEPGGSGQCSLLPQRGPGGASRPRGAAASGSRFPGASGSVGPGGRRHGERAPTIRDGSVRVAKRPCRSNRRRTGLSQPGHRPAHDAAAPRERMNAIGEIK